MWNKSFCSQDCFFVFLLLCSCGLSKALFAISNEKLTTGYILFHKSLRQLTEHYRRCWKAQKLLHKYAGSFDSIIALLFYLTVYQLCFHVHRFFSRKQSGVQRCSGTEEPVVKLISFTTVPLESLLLPLFFKLLIQPFLEIQIIFHFLGEINHNSNFLKLFLSIWHKSYGGYLSHSKTYPLQNIISFNWWLYFSDDWNSVSVQSLYFYFLQ